jgi:predicted transposase YdaD
MGLKEFVLDRERRMARKEGKLEGKLEGREEVKEEKNFIFTQNLITQTDFSDEKIALLANVEIEYVKKMRKSL